MLCFVVCVVFIGLVMLVMFFDNWYEVLFEFFKGCVFMNDFFNGFI